MTLRRLLLLSSFCLCCVVLFRIPLILDHISDHLKMSTPITQVLILDNGANTIKIGFSTDTKPLIIPNCIVKVKSERRRPFIGDQLEECRDYSGIYYILPFEKGYLVNWEVQLQIWDYVFKNKMHLVPDGKNRLSHIALIITEPVYNFTPIREYMLRYLFEEYGFGQVLLTSAPRLASLKFLYDKNRSITNKQSKVIACLVMDSGYSFSHVVPFIEGHLINRHMKRINIGGKALTNHLKEILSYRQVNVLEETYVVNQVKEDCCYVSRQFWSDLKKAATKAPENNIMQDYILPDYVDFRRGFIYCPSSHESLITNEHQRIRMNNERFQVPELLFNPCDVNIDQVGIPHTIVHCVNEFHSKFATKSLNNTNNSLELFEEANKVVKVEKSKYVIESEEEDWIEDSEEEEEEEEADEEIEVEEEKPKKRGRKKQIPKKKKKKNAEDVQEEEEEEEVEEENDVLKMIDQSIYEDENIQPHLYDNIVLIGGNCRFRNFRDRVYDDVRMNVPDFIDLNVTLPSDPITYAWQGGKLLASIDKNGNTVPLTNSSNLLNRFSISQKEYRREGISVALSKLDHSQYPTF